MLKTLAEKVDPKHAAIIVVDIQNDFCHDDGALGKRGLDMGDIQQMARNVKGLIQQAHRFNVPVIYIQTKQNTWTNSETWIARRRDISIEQLPICQEGTWGAEFYVVEPEARDCVVVKHRYSAFIETDLDLILRSQGIRTLIMTGVATNACVDSTLRDGYMKEYYIVALDDGCASTSPSAHQATLSNVEELFGDVARIKDVVACWETAAVPAGA